jgi:hypothetical protein
MNFAAVFRTPCVLICQNNEWSLSLPEPRCLRNPQTRLLLLAYLVARADRRETEHIRSIQRGLFVLVPEKSRTSLRLLPRR